MGEGGPYREMPIPPAPLRAWRPIIERGLAVFNGIVAAYFAFVRMTLGQGPHDVEVMDVPVLLSAIGLLAVVGFIIRMPRALRALLILPSAASLTLIGLDAFWLAWTGQDFVPPRPSMVSVNLQGLVATVAGSLSFETALARFRWRRLLAPLGRR